MRSEEKQRHGVISSLFLFILSTSVLWRYRSDQPLLSPNPVNTPFSLIQIERVFRGSVFWDGP